MREICRLFLPMDCQAMWQILDAAGGADGAEVQLCTGWGALGVVVPAGDDSVPIVPAFPCVVPDWVAQWYCRGQVGRSAHALAIYLFVGGAEPDCHPMDASDVVRCVGMLACTPESERARARVLMSRLLDGDDDWGKWSDLRALAQRPAAWNAIATNATPPEEVTSEPPASTG